MWAEHFSDEKDFRWPASLCREKKRDTSTDSSKRESEHQGYIQWGVDDEDAREDANNRKGRRAERK